MNEYETTVILKSLSRIADALDRLANEAERANDAREEMAMERLDSELDRP